LRPRCAHQTDLEAILGKCLRASARGRAAIRASGRVLRSSDAERSRPSYRRKRLHNSKRTHGTTQCRHRHSRRNRLPTCSNHFPRFQEGRSESARSTANYPRNHLHISKRIHGNTLRRLRHSRRNRLPTSSNHLLRGLGSAARCGSRSPIPSDPRPTIHR